MSSQALITSTDLILIWFLLIFETRSLGRVEGRSLLRTFPYTNIHIIHQHNKGILIYLTSKKDYEKHLAQNIKSKPKAFWQYINSKVKTHPNITELLHSDGTIASSDTEMATMFNNYFSSVFTCKDTTSLPTSDSTGTPLIPDSIHWRSKPNNLRGTHRKLWQWKILILGTQTVCAKHIPSRRSGGIPPQENYEK